MEPNKERVENFLKVYLRHLQADIAANPDSFHARVKADPAGTARRMVDTLAGGTAVGPSTNLRKACKELGVSTTMRNMIDWLQSPDPAK